VRTILILTVLFMLAGSAHTPVVGQSPGGQIYTAGDGVTLPTLVKEVKPIYTASAIRRGVQGTVAASCVVTADGAVADCTVTRGLDTDLDQEAVRAAKQWQFKPGTKDGKPVAVEVVVELSFTLRSDPPVYRIGAGISSPVVVNEVKPHYPEDVMQAGVQGTVELEGIVQIDGSIDSIRVVKGVDERLDREAVKALGQWRFKPGQKEGKDVRVAVAVEINFSVR
jgi:TonB family protein